MIRPVSRSGRFNPGFPLPRLTDVLRQGDRLVSVRPSGGIPLKAHPRCDGTAGLGFPPRSPGSAARLTLVGA